MRSPLAVLGIIVVSACHTVTSSSPPPTTTRTTHVDRPRIDRIAPVAREGSAVVLGRVGARRVALVADEDEDAIHTIDLDARAEIAGRANKHGLRTATRRGGGSDHWKHFRCVSRK